MTAPTTLMRSKLFVPASRPELFAKAADSAADALSFDLEDAVAVDRKEEARATLAAYLDKQAHRQIVVVRVNALGTRWCEADMKAIATTRTDIINVPMAEEPETVVAVAAMLDRFEPVARRGRIRLLVNIETPKALRNALALASAHPRVVGLQIGYADMLEPCDIDRTDEAALGHIRVTTRLAAAEAGIPTYDGSYFDVGNPEDCRAESIAARKSGCAGKSCIHPSQIAIVNEAFSPNPAEVKRARRIVAAAEMAAANGVGAFLVDGMMIDAPFLPRARAIVEWSDRQERNNG